MCYIHLPLAKISFRLLPVGDDLQSYFGTVVPNQHLIMLFLQSNGRIDTQLSDYDGVRDHCFPTIT